MSPELINIIGMTWDFGQKPCEQSHNSECGPDVSKQRCNWSTIPKWCLYYYKEGLYITVRNSPVYSKITVVFRIHVCTLPIYSSILQFFVSRMGAQKLNICFPENAAPVSRTTLRTTGPLYRWTLGSERHRSQLRDPMNSGLTRWRLTIWMAAVPESGKERNPKYQIQLGYGK